MIFDLTGIRTVDFLGDENRERLLRRDPGLRRRQLRPRPQGHPVGILALLQGHPQAKPA